MVCRSHSTIDRMKSVGRGWMHVPLKGSDACTLFKYLGKKCNGKDKKCSDYHEKVVPTQ